MKRISPAQPIRGEKIDLVVPGRADLAFIRRLWADPDTMAAVGGPVEMTDAQMADWYLHMIDPGRGTDLFLLILTKEGEPIGEVSFHRLDLDNMQADFNIKVMASHRGRGYGLEAMEQLLGYFFIDLGGHTMIDDLALENTAGQRMLERFGFVHDASQPGVYRLVLTRQRFMRHAG